MKKLTALLLCTALLLTLAACGKETPTEPTEEIPTENQVFTLPGEEDMEASVYYLNYNPALDAVLQDLAGEYETATGTAVVILTAAEAAYADTLSWELEKDAPPTLFYVENADALRGLEDTCCDLSGAEILNLLPDAQLTVSKNGAVLAYPIPSMEGDALAWTGDAGYWCVNAKASQLDINATLAFLEWCMTEKAESLF